MGGAGQPHIPYGLPLHCPKCPPKHYFGALKIPGVKVKPCPNCGSALVATLDRKARREAAKTHAMS